ncbi:MAG: hypothetical protein WD894_24340 [Pirellulales bacterium]
MRKRITTNGSEDASLEPHKWLDVAQLAVVEVTSEDPSHPIESALVAGGSGGWRAAGPGRQTIRLVFDEPQTIRRIYLAFQETDRPRTQEFVLRWRGANDNHDREIARQQYNFSPSGSTREIEDYRVNLVGAASLELMIVPDISGGEARASLQRMLLE